MLTKYNQKLKDDRGKRVAKIRVMRDKGASVVSIAEKLGISRQRVLQLLKG
jgi:DNA-directed RNA polymerase specialized sigma subunit